MGALHIRCSQPLLRRLADPYRTQASSERRGTPKSDQAAWRSKVGQGLGLPAFGKRVRVDPPRQLSESRVGREDDRAGKPGSDPACGGDRLPRAKRCGWSGPSHCWR